MRSIGTIKIAVLFLIVINLLNCNSKGKQHKQILSLIPTDTIASFPLGNGMRNNSPSMQFIEHNDTLFFSLISYDLKSIDIYSTYGPEPILSISLMPSGLNMGFDPVGYYLISPDSVLVISLQPPIVCLIDGKSTLLKQYDLNNNSEKENVLLQIPWDGQFPVCKGGKLYLGLRHPTILTKGILTEKQNQETNIAVSTDIKSGKITIHPLRYPGSLINKDISGMQVSWTSGYDNQLVYVFDLQDSIYRTADLCNARASKLLANYKFSFADKNFKYINNIEGSLSYNLQHDEIKNIYFDKYRNLYYLCIRERQDSINDLSSDLMTKLQYGKWFIIILDTDLNYMGEVVFPDNLYYFQKIFVVPEGVYISYDHVYNPSFNEDTLKLRLFRIIRTD